MPVNSRPVSMQAMPVLALPKEREFRVELRLPVAQGSGDAG